MLAALVSLVATVPLVTATAAASASCPASLVHYVAYPGAPRGLAQLPWVAASPTTSGIDGHLFYYDNKNVWRQRRLPRARIYARGQSPDGRLSMKILWQTRHTGGVLMQVHGVQLGGTGSFRQQLSPATSNTRQYPSIINVPAAGCWRLTFTAGTTSGRITFIALPGR
jgi:hypothetical protein